MVQTIRHRLTTAGSRKITLEGQTISYLIKRSPKAKNIRLEIRAGVGLVVTIPKRHSAGELPGILEAKRGWILHNIAKYGEDRPRSIKKDPKDHTILFLGRDLELLQRDDGVNDSRVELAGNRLVVTLGPRHSIEVALEQWYRKQAARLISGRVEELSAQLGVAMSRITIRGQKTRWASCSRKGKLSFNWKLMMAPEPVIDYVVIHELAHLKEMNHSKRFWQLVAEHCPKWRKHKKWLKEHETDLATRLLR